MYLALFLGTLGCVSKSNSFVSDHIQPKVETVKTAPLHSELQNQLATWAGNGKPETIDAQRDKPIERLSDWIKQRARAKLPVNIIFVCTHNSRRSHMSELWAKAAAEYLGIENVKTFSGGTESTAFNPRSVRALRTHGFVIEETTEKLSEQNMVYNTSIGEGHVKKRSFSKKYSHEENPKTEFAAVMVCAQADEQCPYVEGADIRISLPFIDPKLSDGSPQEEATYLDKSQEIGREMLWLMQQVVK